MWHIRDRETLATHKLHFLQGTLKMFRVNAKCSIELHYAKAETPLSFSEEARWGLTCVLSNWLTFKWYTNFLNFGFPVPKSFWDWEEDQRTGRLFLHYQLSKAATPRTSPRQQQQLQRQGCWFVCLNSQQISTCFKADTLSTQQPPQPQQQRNQFSTMVITDSHRQSSTVSLPLPGSVNTNTSKAVTVTVTVEEDESKLNKMSVMNWAETVKADVDQFRFPNSICRSASTNTNHNHNRLGLVQQPQPYQHPGKECRCCYHQDGCIELPYSCESEITKCARSYDEEEEDQFDRAWREFDSWECIILLTYTHRTG